MSPAQKKQKSPSRKKTVGANPREETAAPANAAAEFDSVKYSEEVAALAYAMWEERGRTNGSPEEDWYRAEAEIRRRYQTD